MADLQERQVKLLRQLLEATRRVPEGVSTEFIVVSNQVRTVAVFPTQENIPLNPADLHELDSRNLVRCTGSSSRGTPRYALTNDGEELVADITTVPSLVEELVSLVRERLPEQFEQAQSLIDEATRKLPRSKAETHFSEIGHKCREAMQEFAAVLYEKHCPVEQREEGISKENTVRRVRSVLNAWKPRLGETTAAFADALLVYWGTVSDHIQKVEHRSQREGKPLTWDDARRAVLYTYLVMAEITELKPVD